MQTMEQVSTKPAIATRRPFSLGTYLLLVIGLSWPFQIAFAIWSSNPAASMWLSSLSMVMVAVATFIAGRFIFRDGFQRAGWSWGRPKHYFLTFGLALFIFLVPTLLEPVLGMRSLPAQIPVLTILSGFLIHFLITLIPGFGEEFGWRAYMLPHLARRYGVRKGLLLHGLIWWAWHLPAVIAIGAHSTDLGSNAGVSIAATILVTLIPTVMNGVIYGYVWTTTQSLAVSSMYHSAYDEVRDAIEQSIGFGPLVSIWEMLVTTILGAILLWRGNWKVLEEKKS